MNTMIIDSKVFSNVIDQTMEVALAVERLQAVVQSFAQDYIDDTDDSQKAAMYINFRYEHFCRLFNVISIMVSDLEKQTKALDNEATDEFNKSIDRCKAAAGES